MKRRDGKTMSTRYCDEIGARPKDHGGGDGKPSEIQISHDCILWGWRW